MERPISNIDLLQFTNEEISQYLQNFQKELPKKRMVGIVLTVSKKIIDVLLFEGTQIQIKFKDASWAPRKLKKIIIIV